MTARNHHGPEGRHRRKLTTAHSTPPSEGSGPRPAEPLSGPATMAGSFVGRETELAGLSALLATHRLVTLTGPAGVGKTRLARQLAAELPEPQSVYVVDVERVTDPARLAEAVGVQLCAPGRTGTDPLEGLATHVGDARLLVVLDNCEHLVAACAEVVEVLLRRCPGLRVLATSRETLGIVGEKVWSVPPLSTPDGTYEAFPEIYLCSEAVQLFCDRAAAVQRGFLPTAENVAEITEICVRLDGLPLAIELAAARLAVLSLGEIAAGLDDRFTLLVAGPGRGVGARHDSLRHALDASYDRLSASEQLLLARLAVFRGGCTMPAAEEVCAGGEIHTDDVLDLVDALVAKSLIVAETTEHPARYRLLESVRHYAYQRLAQAGETARLQARHGRWCVELLDQVVRSSGRADRAWVERLVAEEENLSAALHWAVGEARLRTVVVLVGRAVPFWWARGRYREAQRWLERALRLKGRAPGPVRIKLLCDAALGAIMLGHFRVAHPYLDEALALAEEFGDPRGRIEALKLLGFTCGFEGDPARGLQLIDEAVTLARAAGDENALVQALAARGRTHLVQGHAREGRRDFEESMALAHGVDPVGVVCARVGVAWAALGLGQYADAQQQLEEALTFVHQVDDRHTAALTMVWLGELERLRGDYAAARLRLEDCAALARDLGTPYVLARALLALGRVAQATGDPDGARGHFEQARSVAETPPIAHLVAAALAGQGQLALTEGHLAHAHGLLDQALAAARACGDQAAEATALCLLGRVARADGDGARAASLHHDALAIRSRLDDVAGVADSLEALAGLAPAKGNHDEAARLFGGAQSIRDARGCVRSPLDQPEYEADVEAARAGLGDEEFDATWDQGATLTVEEVVALASRRRGRQVRASLGWDALTTAERQVVDLVAEGLTNPEIAQRLYVSARTVQTHLRHVFIKLGVPSRTALVAEMARRDA